MEEGQETRHKKHVLLNFQRDIIDSAIENDALFVLAPGLGLYQVVAVLLKLQDERRKLSGEHGVTLVIGADATQRTTLQMELNRIYPSEERFVPDTESEFPKQVTADLSTTDRLGLYASSSCLFVTTRILVVDLLSERLDPKQVSGIIVVNAHRLTDSSGEAFIIKLYKQREGRIWPRFRNAVQDDFENKAPQLVEVSLAADPGASIIYEAIAELLDVSVKELRKHERLDTTDLSPSQGLTTLRSLANYLLKFDAITFLKYLENLRVTDGSKSAWMFHSAAHVIFEAAKGRVYKIKQEGQTAEVEPILEELPKWKALMDILYEVMDDKKDHDTPVLVFCDDEFTCEQLQKVIRPDGAKRYMETQYLKYLASKVEKAQTGVKRSSSGIPVNMAPQSQIEESALRAQAKELGALEKQANDEQKNGSDKTDEWFREHVRHHVDTAAGIVLSSFEDLIKAKGSMALNISSRTNTPYIPIERADNSASANSITRKGGGRAVLPGTEKIRVIVDVREFMSHLPAVLYSQGYNIIPITLEVGDYVLSPEICVERKTIPDLRGSLQSGRLYQQAEAMCKHYSIAILLIEFDGEKAFALQSSAELGEDIQAGHIMSRLVLLCLHHPRLRLVWSRSLHATADIFRQIKANYDEPDPVTAGQVGLEGHAGTSEPTINTTALEMLRRLPGINENNFRDVSREAGSLSGLASMSMEKMIQVMGSSTAGKRLYEFLHQKSTM
eukprot:jgi/Picre1/30478/NNA_005842.t1